MSLYSIDSLENIPAYSSNGVVNTKVELINSDTRLNLKTSSRSSHKLQSQLRHIKNSSDTSFKQETTRNNEDLDSIENSIVTNYTLTRTRRRNPPSKKDSFCFSSSSSSSSFSTVAAHYEKNVPSKSVQETAVRTISRLVSTRLPEVPSGTSLSRSDVLKAAIRVGEEPMKPDKKLGNVLGPIVKECKKPVSYLEQYRRKYKMPSERCIRSPEGSTLSICGDNEVEDLTDEDSQTLAASYRDDRSELSFYHRWIKQPLQEPPTTRSCETIRPVSHSFPPIVNVRSVSEQKLNSTRIPKYRPYTLEDYKTSPAPRADRSLGPDTLEAQAKREWLMRRRSYGDFVSARNRQNIVLQMQKLKSKHVQEGLLPPLRNDVAVSKIESLGGERNVKSENASSTRTQGKRLKRPTGLLRSRKTSSIAIPANDKSKSGESSIGFRSPIASCESLEDSYFEYLLQRHLKDKKMMDCLLKRTMLP